MPVAILAKKIVSGIPAELKPVENPPEGKARFRFRPNDIGKVFYRTSTGIEKFYIIDKGEKWELLPMGKNVRQA